jgi:hypothetical protein
LIDIDNFIGNFDLSFIQKSDFLTTLFNNLLLTGSIFKNYRFWINDTQLVVFAIGLDVSQPTLLATMTCTSFLFAGFTGVSLDNSSKLFLYYQLNASVFAEDQWDASVGGWLLDSFEIATT